MNETKAKKAEKPFSNPELSAFCGQLGLILGSGISAIEGISIMLEDSSSPEEQVILQALLSDLQESGSLSHALRETGLFPDYLLSMAEIGEETGTLDEVLNALSLHYEREELMSRNIRSALTYPLIMSCMMVAVIIILLTRVMPIFNQVFRQLGTEMTGFSQMLMQAGNALNRYSIVFIVILLLVIVAAFFGTRTKQGRAFFHKLGGHLPHIRALYRQIAACRFASGMAIALKSGLTQEQSLTLAGRLVEDPDFARGVAACGTALEEGGDLAGAIHENQLFSGVYSRMISIGARTGELDRVMERIADLSQEEIDNRVSRTLSILEPTLVITLSLIVGVILLSVMLPLMGIMSSL